MNPPRKPLSEKLYKIGSESLEDFQEARSHKVNEKIIMMFYMLISALLWGAMWLVYHYLLSYDWMECILFLSVLGLPMASWWHSKITAYYMNEEGMGFWLAFKLTGYQKIMKLSFIPIIGPLFESLLNPKSPEGEDER